MTITRKFAAALLTAALALGAVACGDDDDDLTSTAQLAE